MKNFYKHKGLKVLCGLLGKSRQAYYEHQWRADQQALNEGLLIELVRRQRHLTPGVGGRKLMHILEEQWEKHNISMGRDQFFNLLRQHDLLIRRRKKYAVTTQSQHWLKKHPNLANTLTINHAEQLWVSDITYIPIQNKFGYLMLITDAYSRKIVGYQFSSTLCASFCVQALQTALKNRVFPERPLMHHSDRGIQYCSQNYINTLNQYQCAISMTQNGDPYENALAERVNGILKQEWKLDQIFDSFEQAQKAIDFAIYHYNHSRPHASCDYLTPQQASLISGPITKRWKHKSKNFSKPFFNTKTATRMFGLLNVMSTKDLFLQCKTPTGLSLNL